MTSDGGLVMLCSASPLVIRAAGPATDEQAQVALGRRATLALLVGAQVAPTAGEELDCSQRCGDTVVGCRLEPAGHVVLARPPLARATGVLAVASSAWSRLVTWPALASVTHQPHAVFRTPLLLLVMDL